MRTAPAPAATVGSATIKTPVGEILLLGTEDGLTALYTPSARYRPPEPPSPAEFPVFEQAAGQLHEYFDGIRTSFDLPLNPYGTAFQRAVWRELLAVPYGRTTTYGAIAQRLGKPLAARAVGRANATNPISIIVPCHRVIGRGGSLTGYAGGLDVKEWLLAHEQDSDPS